MLLALAHLHVQGDHDLARNLVLDGENIIEAPVVALCPQVQARGRVNELRGETHARPGLTDAALQHVTHALLSAHLFH
ncbi:MAG: hypothetical protein KAR22_04020, partial [Gammaproteobacteria bacterium]|nr:hypothetical protein [Gammaproteobacteria bacterium]